MKFILISAVILMTLALPSHAGTDTVAPGPKDMKDMKQVATTTASDAGFYVAVEGGVDFDTFYGNNRQTVDVPGGGVVSSNNRIDDHGWGGVGGIKVGYAFDSFDTGTFFRLQPAVEAEALYIGQDGDRVSNDFITPSETRISTNSGDFFVNGILRFKNSTIFTPYIGAGVGLQYITTHGDYTDAVALNSLGLPVGSHVHATGLDTSDLDFAGQALFGFDIQITPHISLFSEYKFIDAIGTDGKSNFLNGYTYRFKPDQIEQNLATLGVKYSF